jgi:hypothetical protein
VSSQVSQLAALHVMTQVPLPLQAWQLAVLHTLTQVPLVASQVSQLAVLQVETQVPVESQVSHGPHVLATHVPLVELHV